MMDPQLTLTLYRATGTRRYLRSGEPADDLRRDVEEEAEHRVKSRLESGKIVLSNRRRGPRPVIAVTYRERSEPDTLDHLCDAEPGASPGDTGTEDDQHRRLIEAFAPSAPLTNRMWFEADMAFKTAWAYKAMRDRAWERVAAGVPAADELPSGTSTPEEPDPAPLGPSAAKITAALGSLGAGSREAVRLALEDPRTQREVADDLGITRAAYAQRVSRAMKRLQQTGHGEVADAIRRRVERVGDPVLRPLQHLMSQRPFVVLCVLGVESGRSAEEVAEHAAGLAALDAVVVTTAAVRTAAHTFWNAIAVDDRRAFRRELLQQLHDRHVTQSRGNASMLEYETGAEGAYRRLMAALRRRASRA